LHPLRFSHLVEIVKLLFRLELAVYAVERVNLLYMLRFRFLQLTGKLLEAFVLNLTIQHRFSR
jgi:hypothetical protein